METREIPIRGTRGSPGLHSLEKLIEWKLADHLGVEDYVISLHSLEKLIEWKHGRRRAENEKARFVSTRWRN